MMIMKLGLLALAAITLIVLVVLLSYQGRPRTRAPGRRDGPDHDRSRYKQLGRYVCLAAGLVVLAVLSWRTYEDVSSAYVTASAAQTQTVRAPTKVHSVPLERDTIESGRGAIYFFLLERAGTDVLVLQSADRIIRLPEDRNQLSEFHFELHDGTTIDIELRPREWITRKAGLVWQGHGTLRVRGRSFTLSKSGFLSSLHAGQPVVLDAYEVAGSTRLSLAGRGERRVFLVALVEWLDPADPMVARSSQEFVEAWPQLDGKLAECKRAHPIHRSTVPLAHNVFVTYGMAGALLILAALLLAPAFPRRWLRLAAAMTVVSLFAVAMDRAVLETHRRTLAAPHLDARTKAVALNGLGRSVFFQRTATKLKEQFGLEK